MITTAATTGVSDIRAPLSRSDHTHPRCPAASSGRFLCRLTTSARRVGFDRTRAEGLPNRTRLIRGQQGTGMATVGQCRARKTWANVLDPLANDQDVDGGPLTIGMIEAPDGGTHTGQTYTPQMGFEGVAVVGYTACDEGGLCTVGTIEIEVSPRQLDLASGDTFVIERPGAVFLDVAANDQPADSMTIVDWPLHGELTLISHSRLRYKPDLRVCRNRPVHLPAVPGRWRVPERRRAHRRSLIRRRRSGRLRVHTKPPAPVVVSRLQPQRPRFRCRECRRGSRCNRSRSALPLRLRWS